MISVIVPVYNVEKYLKECLDSILSQTYYDFEVLLIDDGSIDASGRICDEYALKDNRVKVIHKANSGVSSTRNIGLEKAKGEFIAFIDGDDKIALNYLAKLHEGILEGEADVCLCKYSRLCEGELIFQKEKKLKTYINDSGIDNYFEKFLSYYITPLCANVSQYQAATVWRMLFRKDKFKYIFNENVSISEDLLFVLKNFTQINRINVIEESLYYYRINRESVMTNYRKNFLVNQNAFLQEFEEIIRGLKLSNKNKENNILLAQKSLYSSFLFGNEIRFRKKVLMFKKNIERYKKTEMYSFLTFKNSFKIKHKTMKIKYLSVWFLVKTKLYKLMR